MRPTGTRSPWSRRGLGVALVVGGLATASGVAAQSEGEPSEAAVTTLPPYTGVMPGMKDTAPGHRRVRAREGQTVVTWVGFQMATEGGQVFIQTNVRAPSPTIVAGAADEVVVEIPDSRLRARNDARPLRTGAFPTAVTSVTAKAVRDGGTRVTIKLRENVGYDLRQEGNYIFLDFRPMTPQPPPDAPTPAGG